MLQSSHSPFLPGQRHFPIENATKLAMELDKAYVDIANRVNDRTIGIFGTGQQLATGENWFISGQRQSTLRQIYTFTTTSSIPHGLNLTQIDRFTSCYGSFTDGTNWYGIIYGSNTSITGQISFYITPTNIVFASGVGAPSVTKGQIVLTWMSYS